MKIKYRVGKSSGPLSDEGGEVLRDCRTSRKGHRDKCSDSTNSTDTSEEHELLWIKASCRSTQPVSTLSSFKLRNSAVQNLGCCKIRLTHT